MEDYYLIVFNICGISGKDNTDYYIEAINTITSQTYTDYKLVVSSCLNPPDQIEKLKNSCNIDLINVVNEVLPVNITFNQAINVGVEHFGMPKGILYLDSVVKFTTDNQLDMFVRLFEAGNFGMASAQVDNDMGWCWFGLPYRAVVKDNFIVPMGRAINLHCQIFHADIYKEFGGVMPDIFKSYCTESTFSFLNAAIGKEWVVSGDYLKVHHRMYWKNNDINKGNGIDGHCAGFPVEDGAWDHCFEPHSIKSIIEDPEAIACGFGYEELRNILNHNPNCYIDNRFCKDPQRLSDFIKKNIFRQKEDFDYSKILQETILC
jgi:hypothetical protein